MAEDAVLGQTTLERMLEGFDVIDTLAHERSFVEQVLIHIRDHARVRIDARFASEHPGKPRGASRAQTGADAGLQDAVALHHALQGRIEARAVERVRQGGDEGACSIPRKLRVRIQGDDVADTDQGRHITDSAHERGRIAQAEQGIERCQLAALALVSHPYPFAGVPLPGAVQQVEAIAALWSVASVQFVDPLHSVCKQGVIHRRHSIGGIEKVRQQHEAQLGIAVGQEAHFQRFGEDIDAVDAGQHRGDCDHGGTGGRDTFTEIELGERPGRHQHRCGPVHQHDAQLAEHQQPEQRGQPGRRRATAAGQQATGGQHREQGDWQQVQRQRYAMRQSRCLAVAWCNLGHRVDGSVHAIADQPVAHVRAWPVERRSPCQVQRDGRHAFFCHAATAGDLFYDMAIGVAGAEIHLRIDAHGVVAQPLFDHAHIFDKGAPIHRGEKAQAANAVADGDLVGRLLLSLGGDQFLDALARCGCPLFQPGDGHGPRATAPLQRAGQFGDEGAGQRWLGSRHVGHHQDHIGRGVGGRAIEVVRPLRRQAAVGSVAHHPRRHAPEILQQGQPQHDGNGPQFAQA